MSFTTPVFFVFLPAVLLLYRGLPQKYRWLLLLIASYLFYAYYDVYLLGLIFLTTLVSWLSALCMEQAETVRGKRIALSVTLVTCVGILFLFKYLNFVLKGVFALSHLLGADISFGGFDILLPMGISFYVFQTMSYVIDIYRGKVAAQRHVGYYALFVVFFPQLVAGPIERPGDLLPQLKQSPAPDREDLAEGFCLFLRGYGKKLLIADYLAGFVDNAYGNIKEAGGAALLAATVLFALQIYCDFSGYSDIASGCARFLGIRLTENFQNPYKAVSIRDFWRRWHISLTRWFTDYLYIPLGGSRKGLCRQCRNILITFLVSGLWHGADLSFVIWGGLHGIYLVIETILFRRKEGNEGWNRGWKEARRILTFLLVCFAWIFFRAASLSDALLVICEILTHPQTGNLLAGLGLHQAALPVLIMMLMLLPLLEKLPTFPQAAPSYAASPDTAPTGTTPPDTAQACTASPHTALTGTAPPDTAQACTASPHTAPTGTAPPDTAQACTASPHTASTHLTSPENTAGQCRTALLYLLLSLTILVCRCLVLTGQGDTAFLYFQF